MVMDGANVVCDNECAILIADRYWCMTDIIQCGVFKWVSLTLQHGYISLRRWSVQEIRSPRTFQLRRPIPPSVYS
ncbi:hypothetical protein GDO78_022026 [Eleutherodactylus coqui]|uniref:Uncharacterized protein n=1 Tax=Eleutherodactylus coqui TaxID=57060 RepID=A0A8J6E547_ELECQ|nr:hypothetical protein GDO78_022026 [Eleutherodactylus coqui]